MQDRVAVSWRRPGGASLHLTLKRYLKMAISLMLEAT